MNKTLGLMVAGTMLVLSAYWIGHRARPDSVPVSTVATLLRTAGDSAVTDYKSSAAMQAFVATVLADTVRKYDAAVKAATKLVVRHDSLHLTDTVLVPVPMHLTDTVLVPLPLVDSTGIIVAESLLVAPAPTLLRRSLHLSFVPDTLLVALLRTPSGIERFTAAGTAAGLHVTTVDAAQVAPPHTSVWARSLQLLHAGSCVVAGVAMTQKQDLLAVVTGTGCVLGVLSL